MDWDTLRNQWREAAPAAPLMAVEELRARDASLWKKVRWRDLLETGAAVVVALFFCLATIGSLVEREWLQAGFSVLIIAWAVRLPFQLRQARRHTAVDGHGASMLEYLRRQRDAALVQARMLERVWSWYLAPPAIGLVGLRIASDGLTTGSLRYIGLLMLLYAVLAWINRYTARTQFRAHAARLQRQIESLEGETG